jgi:excinuclease UvrABC ATPase subunit
VSQSVIRLRGVAVNNLRRINLDLPHRRLIAICGVLALQDRLAYGTTFEAALQGLFGQPPASTASVAALQPKDRL